MSGRTQVLTLDSGDTVTVSARGIEERDWVHPTLGACRVSYYAEPGKMPPTATIADQRRVNAAIEFIRDLDACDLDTQPLPTSPTPPEESHP